MDEEPIRPLDGREYEPTTTGERIGWAMSDLAQALGEFTRSLEEITAQFAKALRENEEQLGKAHDVVDR